MPMIEKHLIYMQRSKKLRKHQWSYGSGPASWVSCLLLMSSSCPGVGAVSSVWMSFQGDFEVSNLSVDKSNVGPSEVGINPRVCFSQFHYAWVVKSTWGIPGGSVLGICLAMQGGHTFDLWFGKFLHAAKQVCLPQLLSARNYWTRAL